MGEPSAEQLLAALAAGQEWAYAALYRQFGQRLFRTAYALLGRADLAEDAVQEVFVALVRSRRVLPRVESLSGYLFVSLRRAVARIAKRQARYASEQSTLQSRQVRWVEQSMAPERRAWLQAAMERLPDAQREVIALKIDGELSFQEIAGVLDISANTAASRYRYGLEKLRALAAQDRTETDR